MSEATKAPNPTILLVFLGKTNGDKKGERWNQYLEVSEEEFQAGALDPANPVHKRERNYDAKAKAVKEYLSGGVGMVYRVEVDPENSTRIYSNTAKYIGRWPNEGDRTKWAARARASLAQVEAIEARDKASKLDPLKEALDPIREAYQSLPFPHRPQLLAQIVEYITRR